MSTRTRSGTRGTAFRETMLGTVRLEGRSGPAPSDSN